MERQEERGGKYTEERYIKPKIQSEKRGGEKYIEGRYREGRKRGYRHGGWIWSIHRGKEIHRKRQRGETEGINQVER